MLWWCAAAALAGEPVVVVGDEEIADPQRWLEHRHRRAVRDWAGERDLATRTWIEEGGQLDAIAAWRAREDEDREPATRLADHRGGTALWTLWEPVLREDAAPEARDRGRSWRSSLYVQAPGAPFPGTLLAEFAPEAGQCTAQLSPDGTAVVWGRADAVDLDAEEPPKRPRTCHLFRQPIGGDPEPLLDAVHPTLAWSDAHLLVAHREGKRGVVTEIVEDGTIERVHRRKPLAAAPMGDGRVIVWTRPRKGWGVDGGMRVAVGPIDDLDWLGNRVFWPWLGDEPTLVGVHDDELLVATDKGAPNGEVVRIDLEHPDSWRTIVAERPGMQLAGARLHGDDLLVVWQRDGLEHLEVQPWDGTPPTVVDLGGPWTSLQTWRTSDEQAVIQAWSPTASRSWLRAPDGTLTPLDGAREDEDLVFEHHLVPAGDGVEVPVSLIRRRDVEPDGDTPVWLDVYGGFDIAISRGLSTDDRLFVGAGGIVATVHVRGGGERGELWHEASRQETLDVRFDDVIDVAEWFVDRGWTSPGRLVLSGGSNGGLTTVAAVARRPDLFGAAIPHAGVFDLLRGPRFGRWWRDEYGSLRDPAQRERLRAESPVQRRPEGPLPPLLIVTGQRDPVVDPSHSYKLAAAWSELPGGPVLLRVDAFGSHGAKARHGQDFGPADYEAASDETLAFVFRALDLEVPARDPG